MNDRFKFRVFDKNYNDYLPRSDCKLDARTGKLVKQSLFQGNRYIIEQCTGLKDKNGKLIFEGDVVSEHFEDDGSIDKLVFYNELQCKWYMRSNFRGSLGAAAFWEFGHHISHKLEIIGNIHDKEQSK